MQPYRIALSANDPITAPLSTNGDTTRSMTTHRPPFRHSHGSMNDPCQIPALSALARASAEA